MSTGRVYSFVVVSTHGELAQGWDCCFSSILKHSVGEGYWPTRAVALEEQRVTLAGHLLEISLRSCPRPQGRVVLFNPKWVLGVVLMFCRTNIALGPVYASYKNQELWLRLPPVIMLSFLLLHVSFLKQECNEGNLLCRDDMDIPWGSSFSLFWEWAMQNLCAAWLLWWLWSQLTFQLSSKLCPCSTDSVVID